MTACKKCTFQRDQTCHDSHEKGKKMLARLVRHQVPIYLPWGYERDNEAEEASPNGSRAFHAHFLQGVGPHIHFSPFAATAKKLAPCQQLSYNDPPVSRSQNASLFFIIKRKLLAESVLKNSRERSFLQQHIFSSGLEEGDGLLQDGGPSNIYMHAYLRQGI